MNPHRSSLTTEELERRAYANGNVDQAALLAARDDDEREHAYQRGYDAGYEIGHEEGRTEANNEDWDDAP